MPSDWKRIIWHWDESSLWQTYCSLRFSFHATFLRSTGQPGGWLLVFGTPFVICCFKVFVVELSLDCCFHQHVLCWAGAAKWLPHHPAAQWKSHHGQSHHAGQLCAHFLAVPSMGKNESRIHFYSEQTRTSRSHAASLFFSCFSFCCCWEWISALCFPFK